MRQKDLAAASGCGIRFISDLENGKRTCEIDRSLKVAWMLGVKITAEIPRPPAAIDDE